jgi:opacity protein-like surface antigen
MRELKRRIRHILCLGVAVALSAGQAAAVEPNIKTIAAGLSYENFSRTLVWKGDTASSRIQANLISARADFGFAKGIVVSLTAGLVLTDFKALTFSALPISLQYDGAPLKGFAFGAEVVAPFLKLSDFEIAGTGRIVYSFGMSKTWPLEGFAVDGKASGESSWFEMAAGPRVSYHFFGRVVPYLEFCARWLGAGFKMTETLEDLDGTEKKQVRGDFAFSAALGADAAVTDRISIKAKAGILPFAGGVDGLISIGVMYKF